MPLHINIVKEKRFNDACREIELDRLAGMRHQRYPIVHFLGEMAKRYGAKDISAIPMSYGAERFETKKRSLSVQNGIPQVILPVLSAYI